MRFFLTGPRIMGIRPGILFRPDELYQKPARVKSSQEGGFIYVISGEHGRVKVGVSGDPNARLADLQTASAVPLTLEYTGALRSNGRAIEAAAHESLHRYRMYGEWFNCPIKLAVAAIGAAAHQLGEPIASVEPARVADIVRVVEAVNHQTQPAQSYSGWLPLLIGFFGTAAFMIYVIYF